MKTFGKALAWFVGGLCVLLLAVGLTVYWALNMEGGQTFVLRTALDQSHRFVDGEVEVGGIRSAGLLRGFTLTNVGIRDTNGRPLLEADSLRVGYSIRGIMAGSVVLSPLELWRPRVTLETLHGDELSNLERIFRPVLGPAEDARDEVLDAQGDTLEARPDPDPGTLQISLRRVAVHDGSVVIRTPVEDDSEAGGDPADPDAPPTGMVVETIPGTEGLYQTLSFTGLQARLGRADLLDPELDGQRFDVESFEGTARVFVDPVRVDGFRGEVRLTSRGIEMEDVELSLPGTEVRGDVMVGLGGEELELELDAVAESLDLADFRWIEPRLPAGTGRMAVTASGPLTSGSWRIRDAELEVEGARVEGRVGLDLAPELSLVDTELTADGLDFALLDPWLDGPLPIDGEVAGRVSVSGPLDALVIDADARWTDEGETLAFVASGTLLLDGDDPGVRGGRVRIDALDYAQLRRVAPDLAVRGTGSVVAELDGRLGEGLEVEADVVHRLAAGGPQSELRLMGEVLMQDERIRLAMTGLLDPLQVDDVARALELELAEVGTIRGTLRADGWLDDLLMAGDLTTRAGNLAGNVRTDVMAPGDGYRVDLETTGLDAGEFLEGLSEPVLIRGRVVLDGRGLDLETLAGSADVDLSGSEVGDAEVDEFVARLRVTEGRLMVDSLRLASPLAQVDGTGELALRPGEEPDGTIELVWELPDLSRFGPLLFGESVVVEEALSDLDRQILAMNNMNGEDDPDADPDSEGPSLAGEVSGQVILSGSVTDLRGEGAVQARGVRWNELAVDEGEALVSGFRTAAPAGEASEGDADEADSGEAEPEGAQPPAAEVGLEVETRLADVRWGRWTVDHVEADGRWDGGGGDVALRLERGTDQRVEVAGAFAHQDGLVELELDHLVAGLDEAEWVLARTAGIRLEGSRVDIRDFEVRRDRGEDAEPVRIRMVGVLDTDGDSDAEIELRQVELDRVGQLLQLEEPPRGILDLEARLVGPAESPNIEGEFQLLDFATDGVELTEVTGRLGYADRLARISLDIEDNGQRLLTANGTWPVDLALVEMEDRFPEREVDIELLVEDLPAATALGFLNAIDQVEGQLDGRVVLRGEPSDLRPSGSLTLSGGALRLAEIGLEPTQIEAAFTLNADGTIDVQAQARSRGLARVSGTIDLSTVSDPGFDLAIEAQGFQAVERRDLDGRVGGEVTLTGRFSEPRLRGNVRVEQGTLYLEEFARSAEVVDLTDPSFLDFSQVDTMLVALQPTVAAAQNPFMDNLVVDVALQIQRDFWLRSREMNVEMQGRLDVNFDRPNREIVLLGGMTATRGNYVAFGRQFQVREGTVEFQGTPGINPILDIRAVHRLRREGGEPLDIVASVEGPLLNLRIGLESDAQPPIAESDLISYLVFGRPAYALASGQSSALQDAAGAGLSVGIGTLATQLSSLVGQQIGLDYFAITQSQEAGRLGAGAGVGGTFAETEVELGQYLTDDIFLALVLRPLQGLGGARAQVPGARLEWRFAETWTLEGYVEDRFGREAGFTFGDPGLSLARVLGLEIYRNWGY